MFGTISSELLHVAELNSPRTKNMISIIHQLCMIIVWHFCCRVKGSVRMNSDWVLDDHVCHFERVFWRSNRKLLKKAALGLASVVSSGCKWHNYIRWAHHMHLWLGKKVQSSHHITRCVLNSNTFFGSSYTTQKNTVTRCDCRMYPRRIFQKG